MMKIVEIVNFDQSIADEIRGILPQLSKSATPPDDDHIKKIILGESTRLIVALDSSGELVGCLTLVVFPIPTGTRAWVEDVIVDNRKRKAGIGTALNQYALKVARSENARTIDLTSRPARKSANNLYKKIGFVKRDTNVYRYEIS